MPYPINDNLDPIDDIRLKPSAINNEAEMGGLVFDVGNPVWVSVSEAAKFGGIQTKTIRRAIEANQINFITKNNRYQIELGSVLKFVSTRKKLEKKFLEKGLGQYWNRGLRG